MQKLIFLLAFTSAVPQPAVAQAANALRQGVRIEVTPVNGKPQTGTLMSLRNDSLFYAPGGARVQWASFAFADVKSVRVSRGGNALGGALKKGLLGTGIGIVSGAIIGAAISPGAEPDRGARVLDAIVLGVLGGGAGLIAGTIYGAAHGNERWESVELPRR